MQAFVLRVWEPGDSGASRSRLRGVVRHVPTGHEVTFTSEAELVAFVRASLSPSDTEPRREKESS